VLQGALKFETTSANVAEIFSEQANAGDLLHRSSSLVAFLIVNQDLAREN
jgi:hypothetical protein